MEHYFTNNLNIKSELRTLSYTYDNHEFAFYSDNGVFSKDKLDFGSRLLVDCIIKNNGTYKDILDVGCGIGFIGIVLGKIFNSKVLMTDINDRAVHLTEKNIIYNSITGSVVSGSSYSSVSGSYDLVVTNPPIRAGKSVVLDILLGAKNYLRDDGELWFVMRKDHGVKSVLKTLESTYDCRIVDKSKGFYIIMAKIVDKAL